MNKNGLIQRVYYTLSAVIAFILPFGNALSSPFIGLWFIFSVLNYKTHFSYPAIKNRHAWLILTFFLLTLVSNFVFYNPADPFSEVEVKLSFLFFPICFFFFDWTHHIAKRTLASFVSGCHIVCLLCLGRAFFYLLQGSHEFLYYSGFSWFMHSSYFAMYLNLALMVVLFYYLYWFRSKKIYWYFSIYLLILFTACIILCASKIGLFALFLLTPMFIAIRFRKRISFKLGAISLGIIFILVFGVYKVAPGVFQRLQSISNIASKEIDKTSAESSEVRVLIWGEAVRLSEKYFFTGSGVSWANTRLYEAYADKGYTGALERKLNAHNQFFQTMIGLGILGFLLLLYFTLGAVIEAIKNRKYILLFFAVLTSVNFFVESMLQTSAGTVFFVFFLCFFLKFNEKKLLYSPGTV